MTSNPSKSGPQRQKGFKGPIYWIVLMLLASLSVWLINGKPLFYYDSPAYVDQGLKIIDRLGIGAATMGTGAEAVAESAQDASVNGSRSAVFAAAVALLVWLRGVELVPLANLAVVAVSVWLTVRVLNAENVLNVTNTNFVAVPMLIACAGSLPFYVAFVMPDLMAAVLLLMIGILTVFGARMQKSELLAAFIFGVLAVVSHISHIAIAAAMLPVVALGGLAMGNRKWWLPSLLVGLMVLGGLGERLAFRVAAKSVAGAEVIYIPFLTARLIEDGPGYRYLQNSCPNPALDSCVLADALSKSVDPMRLTASHIIFETNPQLGSFKFLDETEQAAVAREQYRFFFSVLAQEPAATVLSIVRNTLKQAGLFSVQMTIPTDHIVGNTHAAYPELIAEFGHGRISDGQNWLATLDAVHSGVYALSALVIVAGLIWRVSGLRDFKAFVFIVLLGIAANAFVCGAVSQPADRYGARVIWLLPLLAAMFALLLAANKRDMRP